MVTALIIIAVLIALFFVVLYLAYHKAFYTRRKDMSETELPPIIKNPYKKEAQKIIHEMMDMPCEKFTVTSHDGLRLTGLYYKGKDDMPLCICFHGYQGSPFRDFAAISTFLMREGYNVLVVYQRGHWRSQGHTLTFGVKERFDVLTWVDFARRHFGEETPIYLFGISMGGGTVLMSSGLELPDNVRSIVADCPFNAAKDEIKYVCKKLHLNPTICWPPVWLGGLVYGRFNVAEVTSESEVKKTTKPILIIHGEGDDFVPAYFSAQVKEANPDMVEYLTVPEAGHGQSIFFDREKYETTVKDFLKKTL